MLVSISIPETEIDKYLRADAVVPQIRSETELYVRLDRGQPVILERIGFQLVVEPDATALLTHVEKNPPPFPGDALHGKVSLLAAIAPHAAEDIAGKTFAVHPHQYRFRRGHVSHHQGDMLCGIDIVL
jgi:hypothetical protein